MAYSYALEQGHINYDEIEPLYRMHYAEMQARLAGDGVKIGDYKPNLDSYFASFKRGILLNYIVRCDGKAIGYSNVYVVNDMHNGELIATEDTIYVHPDHRNGVGRKLVKFILADLEKRHVLRVHISPVTDLRVAKIWRRMGFKDVATTMTYTIGE